MQLNILEAKIAIAPEFGANKLFEDPLEADRVDDPIIVTTRRCLVRLALVAAETASRFEREGIEEDPVAWMLAPRRLFGGRAAVEACLNREDCVRAVLLHGLALDLDAEPEGLDWLMEDDDEWEESAAAGDADDCPGNAEAGAGGSPYRWRLSS